MKSRTHKRIIVNPNISDIKSAMCEVEGSPEEGFIILERDDGTFIQGLYVKGASDIRLSGVLTSQEALKVFVKFCGGADWKELTKWKFMVEKESVLQLTDEEKESLLDLIEVELEVRDRGAVILDPAYIEIAKRYVQQLTEEEKEHIIKEAKLSEPVSEIELCEADLRRWLRELRKDVVERGVVGEGYIITLGSYLSGYLGRHGKKPRALESIYTKCKKYDENIP